MGTYVLTIREPINQSIISTKEKGYSVVTFKVAWNTSTDKIFCCALENFECIILVVETISCSLEVKIRYVENDIGARVISFTNNSFTTKH